MACEALSESFRLPIFSYNCLMRVLFELGGGESYLFRVFIEHLLNAEFHDGQNWEDRKKAKGMAPAKKELII